MDFPITLQCHLCPNKVELRFLRHYKQRMKTHNRADICRSCACKKGAKNRPQNTKEYWKDQDIKNNHSISISNSEQFKDGIKNRDTSGMKNPMYGKRHSEKTKKQMKNSHLGKIKAGANKWQEGQLTLVRMIKGFQYSNLGWYKAVKHRDGYKCTKCSSAKHLDSHHIIPIKTLISKLLISCPFDDKNSQYFWLIEQPEINDVNFLNGITLCRLCHKEIHQNWGSHNPKVNQ